MDNTAELSRLFLRVHPGNTDIATGTPQHHQNKTTRFTAPPYAREGVGAAVCSLTFAVLPFPAQVARTKKQRQTCRFAHNAREYNLATTT